MPQNFIACDREQELLLPPSLRDWLPEDHFEPDRVPRRLGFVLICPIWRIGSPA